jgi:hypothetical protein
MKKAIFLFLSFFFISYVFTQQTDNTLKNFEFLVEQLRTNYVGYDLKKPQLIETKITSIRNILAKNPTNEMLFNEFSKLLISLKDLHIRFSFYKNNDSIQNNNGSARDLKYEEKLSAGKSVFEGIWKSSLNDLVVKIKRISIYEYAGYIVESKNEKYKKGDRLFELHYVSKDTYTTSLITATKTSFLPTSVKNNELMMGVFFKWIKISNYKEGLLDILEPFKFSADFKTINQNWSLIKIPKSDFDTKRVVDSLIYLNKEKIESSQNLIIDIRNNAGGTWTVYDSLLKYIFTKPVISFSSLYKCSDALINEQKEIVKYDSTSNIESYRSNKMLLDSFAKYYKKFYLNKPDTIFKPRTNYNLPKNVYIICNFRSVSSSEMFIKFCQQSTKTKLYGEKTFGAANYVESISFKTDDGKFEISLPSVKCVYADEKSDIDFRGIVPNITISDNVKDWVQNIIKNNE